MKETSNVVYLSFNISYQVPGPADSAQGYRPHHPPLSNPSAPTYLSEPQPRPHNGKMMRIAVAGGGGLGYMLATSLSQADNAYSVVVLSRKVT